MVKGNEVGVEKSESEGWLFVSIGLGEDEVVSEVVHLFIIGGVVIVMVVDLINVEVGIGIVTEMDDMVVVVASEALEDFGGEMVIVLKGMYDGGEG